MNELETPEGKLLFLVYEMHQRGEISQKDRGILKGTPRPESDMIVTANINLLEKYREYDNNGTELTLKNSLRSLLWNKKHESTPPPTLRRNRNRRSVECLKFRHQEEDRCEDPQQTDPAHTGKGART